MRAGGAERMHIFFFTPVAAARRSWLVRLTVSMWARAHTATLRRAVQTDRRQAGRQTHFSECVAAVLSVHSFTVPVHCSLIMARPHSRSAPLLSPPGCPSVHLRDRLCGLAAADHSLMISKNNCGSISHTRGSKRFSKLLILLFAIFFGLFCHYFFSLHFSVEDIFLERKYSIVSLFIYFFI